MLIKLWPTCDDASKDASDRFSKLVIHLPQIELDEYEISIQMMQQ